MSVALIMAPLMLSQAPIVAATHEQPESNNVDVAYAELAGGEPSDAITRLRSNRELDSQDPARLINLGAAYSQQGRFAKAEKALKAAIMSNRSYVLELADGRWMDSRQIARMALEQVQGRRQIASW